MIYHYLQYVKRPYTRLPRAFRLFAQPSTSIQLITKINLFPANRGACFLTGKRFLFAAICLIEGNDIDEYGASHVRTQ